MTALDAKALEMARLMAEGSEFDETVDGKPVAAGWPMTLAQAARLLGVPLRKARELADSPIFAAELDRLLKARRASEKARNLNVAIEIRDDRGEGLAADRTVRLKAISTIEGVENKGVTVNVNSNNQTLNVQPGYIIRLPAKRDAALEAPPMRTIDHEAADMVAVSARDSGEI